MPCAQSPHAAWHVSHGAASNERFARLGVAAPKHWAGKRLRPGRPRRYRAMHSMRRCARLGALKGRCALRIGWRERVSACLATLEMRHKDETLSSIERAGLDTVSSIR